MSAIEENTKKYLNFPKILGYGFGEAAGGCFFTFVTSFVMLYLTNIIGLNAGIIGTLILCSKCLDGITDLICGKLIDNTKSKMGKARPWFFLSAFPLAVCEILLFSVPVQASEALQYGYFFVIYTASTGIFYTANNIAYSTMTALVTKNSAEQVQMGCVRYIFAMVAGIIISSGSMGLVAAFGGGVKGWRYTAILYALVLIIGCIITTFSVKEIADDDSDQAVEEQKLSFIGMLKVVFRNKYYIMMLLYLLFSNVTTGITTALGIYYCKYVLNNETLLGIISLAYMGLVFGLIVSPLLIKKMGMYKCLTVFTALSAVFAVLAIGAGVFGSFPLLLLMLACKSFFLGPMGGALNAIIAEIGVYTYLREGVHVEASLFSCTSVGTKVGSGIGTAVGGWILVWGNFEAALEVQSAFTQNIITVGYLVVPAVLAIASAVVLKGMKVFQDNEQWRREHEVIEQ